MAQTVKSLPANAGDLALIPGWEGPLEKRVVTHFSILAGKFNPQRSLWATVYGVTESDMTERLTLSLFFHCISMQA